MPEFDLYVSVTSMTEALHFNISIGLFIFLEALSVLSIYNAHLSA